MTVASTNLMRLIKLINDKSFLGLKPKIFRILVRYLRVVAGLIVLVMIFRIIATMLFIVVVNSFASHFWNRLCLIRMYDILANNVQQCSKQDRSSRGVELSSKYSVQRIWESRVLAHKKASLKNSLASRLL